MGPGRPQAPSGRLDWLDRLRGLATGVMLEVHVVNALLAPRLRTGRSFAVLNFVNGLVAPAFLFCAGFALALGLRRQWGAAGWTSYLGAGLRRGLYLLAVGYGLHGLSLVWHRPPDVRAWREFLDADILQVIALSLTWLVVLAVALRRQAPFTVAAGVTGAVVFVATPWVRALDVSHWPLWAQPYASDRVVSEFPLFPWAGFALLGAALPVCVCAGWGRKLLVAAAAAAAGAAFIGVVSSRTGLFPPHDPWRAGPPYMLLRLAVVCALAALLSRTGSRTRARTSAGGPPKPALPVLGHVDAVLRRYSRHSLLIYVVHVPLVYGGYGASLRASLGATQGHGGCAAWTLALSALMYLLAAAVDAVRGDRRQRARMRRPTAGAARV